MKQELQKYINEWTNADSNVGKENISRGKSFEKKCENEGVNLILKSLNLKRKDVQVYTNLSWAECPGEIDIVILDKSGSRILCLAECKSRFFDIVQGYKQSGPDRAPEKQSIQFFKKTLPVTKDVKFYVLTCLPKNEYFLGIESKVKGDLNKFTLENDFEDINFDEVYNFLRPKYEKQISPLSWFKKHSKDKLFVFN